MSTFAHAPKLTQKLAHQTEDWTAEPVYRSLYINWKDHTWKVWHSSAGFISKWQLLTFTQPLYQTTGCLICLRQYWCSILVILNMESLVVYQRPRSWKKTEIYRIKNEIQEDWIRAKKNVIIRIYIQKQTDRQRREKKKKNGMALWDTFLLFLTFGRFPNWYVSVGNAMESTLLAQFTPTVAIMTRTVRCFALTWTGLFNL